jgi:hypothetical protein
MNRPPFATALVVAALLTPTIVGATPTQDLARAFRQFDNHQWRTALPLANAYLAANGRNYSAELIAAGSACKLHPHLKSNAAPFQKLRADYSLPPQQDRAVRDWIDICTSPPPQPQPQEAGVSVSGLTVEPNTRVADPNAAAPPLRHPPQPPVIAHPGIAHPVVVAVPANSKPAPCRALDQVAQNPSASAATIATLRTQCNRASAPAVSPVVTLPPLAPADACADGYVWREAFAGDHVCVVPATRTAAAVDNAAAASRIDPNGAYGPATCAAGYVWRDARPGDTVCVTPARRSQAKTDNAQAGQRLAL